MSVSYRVGDKVRVLTLKELIKKFGEPDEYGGIWDAENHAYFFADDMIDCCNRVATVTGVDGGMVRLNIRYGIYRFEWLSSNFVRPLRRCQSLINFLRTFFG